MPASRRPWRILLRLLLIFSALTLVLVELGLALRDLREQHGAALAPLPAPGEISFLGINADLIHAPPDELHTIVTELATTGFGWVRFRLPWNEIEAEPNRYQWEASDAVVHALIDAGLTPVVVLDGTPIWARAAVDQTAPTGDLAPPADLMSFAAFAQAVATRYQAQVRYYQIWDEPNIAPHWGARHINPTGYAHLLRAGARAIRAVNPDAQILLAALAPTADRGHLAQDEVYFLRRVYAAGAAEDFDIVALQPFGFATRPDEPTRNRLRLNFSRAQLVRSLLVEAGDGTKPIWLVRYGWNRQPGSSWLAVSPAQQVEFALTGLDIAYAEWPWAAAMGWADAGIGLARGDPRTGFALTPELIAGFRQWSSATTFARPAALASPPRRDWLPVMGWMAAALWLVVRGGTLAGQFPWPRWRTWLAGTSPLWLGLLWGGLLVVYYLATWPPLILFCWLVAAGLIALQPSVGLGLALACLPFHDYHKEFTWIDLRLTLPPTQALLLCLLPAAFFSLRGAVIRDRGQGLALGWLGISLLGFTGAWYAPAFLRGLVDLVLVPLLIFVLLRGWAVTPRAATGYLVALAGGGVLAAGVGLIDWLGGGGTVADGFRRLSAPTFSPNQTALYLVRTLFVVFGLVMAARGWQRWGGRGALALVVAALALTGSRGGLLLGIPGGLLVWFGLRARQGQQWRTRLPWLAGMVLLLALAGGLWGARLGNLATVGTRLEGWQAALWLWRDYPWLGVGPYGFWYRFPAYMPLGSALDPELRHPHNIWLEYATGGGLAALIWLGMAAAWLVHWARQHAPALTWTQLGLLSGLAAGLAHGQVDAFAALPDLAAWNWAALALILAEHAAQQKAALQMEDGS